MAIQKKLSKGTTHLLARLEAEVKAVIGDDKMPGDLEITLDNAKLGEVLTDYRTTTSVGERAVTVDDIEAVGNFRRDLQNATRMFAGDTGLTYMQTNEDADSYRITVNTQDNALSVQSAFFRPGKEEQGNTNFVSITDQWTGSDEDKAIENHLKGLTKTLAGAVKK
jgi:hypothetical protein